MLLWLGWGRTVFLTVFGAAMVMLEAFRSAADPLLLAAGMTCLLGETAFQTRGWWTMRRQGDE